MKHLLSFAVCASLCLSVGAMAQQRGDAETDLWNAIDPKQPCEYKAYLEDYPKGKYASLARLRLAACPTVSAPATVFTPAPISAAPAVPAPAVVSTPPISTPAAVSTPTPISAPAPIATPAAAAESRPVEGDTPVAKLDNMLRQRRIFNCGPDGQSLTVRAGVLNYASCSFDGTRVTGSAVLSSLAVGKAYLKPLDDALIQREPALRDYVALWVPCARGTCYSIELTSTRGNRIAQTLAAMAFYVPRSSGDESLGLVKALAAPVNPG